MESMLGRVIFLGWKFLDWRRTTWLNISVGVENKGWVRFRLIYAHDLGGKESLGVRVYRPFWYGYSYIDFGLNPTGFQNIRIRLER